VAPGKSALKEIAVILLSVARERSAALINVEACVGNAPKKLHARREFANCPVRAAVHWQ
jgi:hypothetical protein